MSASSDELGVGGTGGTRMRRIVFSAVALATSSLLAAAVAMSAGGASTNLIRNGGFEQPVVGTGKYRLFSVGQSFPRPPASM
jgi:hypothetical protein